MIGSTKLTAALLVASVASSMAAIPTTGTYTLNGATTGTAPTAACDKVCLKVFMVASNAAINQVSMMGKSEAPCTCTSFTVPYTANGISFTGQKLSTATDAASFSGTVAFTAKAANTTTPAPGTGTPAGSNSTVSTNTTTTTTSSSSTAAPSATPSTTLLQRRVFKRAASSPDVLVLTLTAGTATTTANYVRTADTSGDLAVPTAAAKALTAGFAVVSAGIAAALAGIMGM
ncbi:hypothetical protein DFJ77DRAFT_465750 [Powellomyces hirtus]|nr:hypothetical protein DFJ77DRAFT_465750 [Powellomyces hirtus]